MAFAESLRDLADRLLLVRRRRRNYVLECGRRRALQLTVFPEVGPKFIGQYVPGRDRPHSRNGGVVWKRQAETRENDGPEVPPSAPFASRSPSCSASAIHVVRIAVVSELPKTPFSNDAPSAAASSCAIRARSA